MATPDVPSATTVSPITAPLENATLNAGARPVVAANVVRTAAPVAVRIPTQPAIADKDEPIRKLTPVRSAFSGRNRTRITNISPTNPASTVYSVRRKAIAPERINAAIRCITSVPGSRLLIVRIKKKAKTAAAKGAPHPSAKYSCCSIHSPIVL